MICVEYCWIARLLYHYCYSEVCIHLYPMFLCQTNASQVVWGRAWSNKIRPDTRSMALWLLPWYTLVNQHGWLEKGRWKKMHVSLKMVLLHCHGFICLPEPMLFFLTDSCFGILTQHPTNHQLSFDIIHQPLHSLKLTQPLKMVISNRIPIGISLPGVYFQGQTGVPVPRGIIWSTRR